MSPLDLLGRIANVEFAAMVTQVNRLGSKLRIHLVDKSYIDVSRKLPDLFGFHFGALASPGRGDPRRVGRRRLTGGMEEWKNEKNQHNERMGEWRNQRIQDQCAAFCDSTIPGFADSPILRFFRSPIR